MADAVIWSATPTPFLPGGALDIASTGRVVEHHLRLGLTGLFACGSCGEGPWMPDEQRAEWVRVLKEEAGALLHVAAQVSDLSAARVIRNMDAMAEAGADSLVIAPPYSPRMVTPGFLFRYFTEALEDAPLPVGLYLLPASVAPAVPLELWLELARHPRVRFLKDSTSSPEVRAALLAAKAHRPELTVLTGDEFDVVGAVADGYDGGLAGTGILIGGLLRRALGCLASGDRAAADGWQVRSNELLWGVFRRDISRWLGGLKHALVYLDLFADDFLHLDYPLTADDRREVEAVIDAYREFICPS